MKKVLIGLGIVTVILGITNPSVESHKQAVIKTIAPDIKDEIKKNPFMALASKMMESMIDRDNYILFSLTKISAMGESKIVGYGVLGNVYISDKIKAK